MISVSIQDSRGSHCASNVSGAKAKQEVVHQQLNTSLESHWGKLSQARLVKTCVTTYKSGTMSMTTL